MFSLDFWTFSQFCFCTNWQHYVTFCYFKCDATACWWHSAALYFHKSLLVCIFLEWNQHGSLVNNIPQTVCVCVVKGLWGMQIQDSMFVDFLFPHVMWYFFCCSYSFMNVCCSRDAPDMLEINHTNRKRVKTDVFLRLPSFQVGCWATFNHVKGSNNWFMTENTLFLPEYCIFYSPLWMPWICQPLLANFYTSACFQWHCFTNAMRELTIKLKY